ncbi:pachytene checkpoint protein 2 homolog isoform X1 [Triplophysa dalaica]|uniref:pachytene checkpoint protein 2 homolog isoform X1 n=1 Tax=Triplophysa dalaica TaxID=1582913 RepID=UPI0024DF3C1A|nr:pachytene checkpoint protein 2 homolog isoform X1 [Triplophysa dalaica]XP_056618757.1 pachytene checkpoint protein 2 homolog isoform X1 [Triplophysa dalaica]XP_056618758.1 pachytene checkpoint protein 2 homolog isoform X1 [Triplophysa dalaica]
MDMSAADQHMTDVGLIRPDVHIEVHVKSESTVKRSDVRAHVLSLLDRHSSVLGSYKWTEFDNEFLTRNVQSVTVTDITGFKQFVDLKLHNLCIYIFSLNDEVPNTLTLEEEEELSAANHWLLPSAEFHGIWECLIYEDNIKTQLLDYVTTTIFFSDKNVDSNLIAWNRVVLLHGPPGTGKTSLCKGLAQKLSIRLSGRYAYSQFVEINSHSLFSKWFSESGKLVTKMFQKIQELIDDKDALVFVLIDEVESLTAARNAAQAGTEPSDAIRVVNSVLTQLDQIKRYPNVVILTTSNVTEKIDLAFVDRADIKQYIGPPSANAIFHIYLSCLEELMKCQIIYPRQQLLRLEELITMNFMESDLTHLSLMLRKISQKSVGFSGRTLRKIPFLAHALYGKTPTLTVESFLKAMDRAVDNQKQEQANLVNCV